uniref:Uncharacterized protein n=1 Tax=Aegilops tauschii subsp. strangulata TaxID=200361 RepID=A0A453GJF6_AEGTS
MLPYLIYMMMDCEKMGYRIDWLKKVKELSPQQYIKLGNTRSLDSLLIVVMHNNFQFMFPVNFMDCWSVYILEKDKKIVMVLDPTETYPEDEIKIKHEPLAKKFQKRFCNLFNDVYGAGLVETTGSSFVYPLEAQHEPCSRSVHLHHCLSGSSV